MSQSDPRRLAPYPEGLGLVLVLVSLRREGGDGTALTLLSVGGRDPTVNMRWKVGGWGNNHIIGWWEGGYLIRYISNFLTL